MLAVVALVEFPRLGPIRLDQLDHVLIDVREGRK